MTESGAPSHDPLSPTRNGGAEPALAAACARHIVAAFANYNADFRAITRRAPGRFDQRDLVGSQRDAAERIDLYDRAVKSAVAQLELKLGEHALDRPLWQAIRNEFAAAITGVPDNEFTKTFFSSITRRLFRTVGVAPEIEFVATDLDPLASVTSDIIFDTYTNRGALSLLVEDMLDELRLQSRWRDFDHSVQHVANEIERHHGQSGERRAVQRIELIKPVFYQIGRAYLVGRVIGRGYVRPLVIALKNTERGILVDTVMLNVDDVSILFGFTRSYFHVDLDRVGETVVFLKQLMPRKPVSELFTVLGRAKQGKTERFRELMRHLATATDRFVHAPGERGLVMVCFTLPSFDIVFKVIRDRFPYPKSVLREDVLAKYHFVFKHDRAGRLVDAQEFKRLRFRRALFAPELIEELLSETANTVHVEGDDLIFDHLYIERRMTPLNLYLRQVPAEVAERAVIDYGQAIRDLAYTNIFAGDLLLKNFGVTRHGRVIFYDYDELCQVSDCRFRDLPQAQNDEDEMRGEPWFYVGDNDVFPETFAKFLAFDEAQLATFMRVHGDILTADFWRQLQTRIAEGEVLEVLPYSHHRVRVAGSH
ncbi:MAG TPA: bifunctional isocitrate dehydrogenase kinase/phosphatase [Steroidobacteraceae bacterium]|nr:bifunctional isocitrate dehydrogenase kinase/phosphatase [Steroidobacteraceae bacterium]